MASLEYEDEISIYLAYRRLGYRETKKCHETIRNGRWLSRDIEHGLTAILEFRNLEVSFQGMASQLEAVPT